jgi:hypothetical protein
VSFEEPTAAPLSYSPEGAGEQRDLAAVPFPGSPREAGDRRDLAVVPSPGSPKGAGIRHDLAVVPSPGSPRGAGIRHDLAVVPSPGSPKGAGIRHDLVATQPAHRPRGAGTHTVRPGWSVGHRPPEGSWHPWTGRSVGAATAPERACAARPGIPEGVPSCESCSRWARPRSSTCAASPKADRPLPQWPDSCVTRGIREEPSNADWTSRTPPRNPRVTWGGPDTVPDSVRQTEDRRTLSRPAAPTRLTVPKNAQTQPDPAGPQERPPGPEELGVVPAAPLAPSATRPSRRTDGRCPNPLAPVAVRESRRTAGRRPDPLAPGAVRWPRRADERHLVPVVPRSRTRPPEGTCSGHSDPADPRVASSCPPEEGPSIRLAASTAGRLRVPPEGVPLRPAVPSTPVAARPPRRESEHWPDPTGPPNDFPGPRGPGKPPGGTMGSVAGRSTPKSLRPATEPVGRWRHHLREEAVPTISGAAPRAEANLHPRRFASDRERGAHATKHAEDRIEPGARGAFAPPRWRATDP